jgi:thiosulfate/3-mercaptopyruvate sulfurtransferase
MSRAGLPPVVSADWLTDHLDEVVLCDVRWYLDGRSGRAAYEAGHLPGAVFVDLDRVLADPPAPGAGRHPLPSPERFAADLGRLGIGDDATVVAYDDAGGTIAARLVWMLRVIGQDAAFLDGGIGAWTGVVTSDDPRRQPIDRRPVPWPPGAIADADTVAAHVGAGGTVVDARAPERYRGDVEPVDPRAGHIPGARSLPAAGNLVDGRLLPTDALRRRIEAAGVDDAAIVYCGSGVTACHDVLAAEHAGLGRPRLFVGSWSAWSSDPERPVATGDEP